MSIFHKITGKSNNTNSAVDEEFEKATFYLRPEQRADLDEIKYRLKRERIRTNNSELVRFAIDLLKEKSLHDVKQLLKKA